MKSFIFALAVSLAAANTSHSAVQPLDSLSLMGRISHSLIQTDNLGWVVGDNSEFDVKLGSFGKIGTMTQSVTKDEGTAIWMKQEMNMMGQKQTIEMLLNKEDAKVLKYIENGKEKTPPSQDIEMISQEYTEVKVPAGTFTAIHIVAKTKDIEKLEVWNNAADTVMDGTLKMVAPQMGMEMVIELIKFTKVPRN